MELADLFFYNSHWQTGDLPKNPHSIKRKLFKKLAQTIGDRYIITIQGLRRTGKSVLQSQYVDAFFEQFPEISQTQLLKYTFEKEDDLDLLPSQELIDLLHLYFHRILQTQPALLNKKTIIALDEIQNVDNWQSVIKKYYDINENIKFVLTGSSSLYLKEGAESLAGRSLDFELECLDFQEYLAIIDSPIKPPFAESLDDLLKITPFDVEDNTIKTFENFLCVGGFPETALMFKTNHNIKDIHRFIRESIINKVIKRDLKKYFQIKNTIVDQRMFQVCCKESSGFMELSKLAPETGLSLVSIKKHLEIFKKSHLVHFLSKFDKKIRREIKSTRKVYVASPCFMFAMVPDTSLENREYVGHVAETYAFNQLRKLEENLYVEKGKESREEIDFYFPEKKLLIECKYTQIIDARKFAYLLARAQALGTQNIVFSKNSWGDVHLKSCPLFLLATG
ncbi:MAG: hypothetical protein ACD_62C00544G0006 [uncultured bacterium]|nr:MAG: hypothetical protein ACD_62C00544G0006 [uncultured bacterium]